ncbi:hypothetical protein AXG93_3960s1210 [Marchantia polymorpha subsp. ruderalis]|uniref:Uncharacterized protein n=1 Tax=Marchantia polymorpha subsp. ruderalis TaxID=1480154 RepID=A0A176VH88_MARPO|nr:hypothetical protein AXG93_3960s1210 [Marchantia polymorpha subsp. ruderalis]
MHWDQEKRAEGAAANAPPAILLVGPSDTTDSWSHRESRAAAGRDTSGLVHVDQSVSRIAFTRSFPRRSSFVVLSRADSATFKAVAPRGPGTDHSATKKRKRGPPALPGSEFPAANPRARLSGSRRLGCCSPSASGIRADWALVRFLSLFFFTV